MPIRPANIRNLFYDSCTRSLRPRCTLLEAERAHISLDYAAPARFCYAALMFMLHSKELLGSKDSTLVQSMNVLELFSALGP
jgi:hypothetical protein